MVEKEAIIESDTFQNLVNEYVLLHDKKAELRSAISELNKRQKQIQEALEKIMAKHEITDKLDLGDGTLGLAKSKRTSPINKVTIYETLCKYEFFNRFPEKEKIIQEMVEFLYANREVHETMKLRRTRKRKT